MKKVKSKLDYRDLIHYQTIVSSYINDLKGLVDIFKIPNQTTYDVDNAIKASKEILRVIENRINYDSYMTFRSSMNNEKE